MCKKLYTVEISGIVDQVATSADEAKEIIIEGESMTKEFLKRHLTVRQVKPVESIE